MLEHRGEHRHRPSLGGSADLTRPESEEVIRDAVTRIVDNFLPGVRLAEMIKNPP